jgi:6-pyruvoyltetrahydropterin/6-carboxytetrahydropterin synthase
MYELSVERDFCAAHTISIAGRNEPAHGHNWHVTLVVSGDKLNADGLLCDFHWLERRLDEVIGGLHNANLNATPPFDRVNPTAEHVARHIAVSVAPLLPANVKLSRVNLTEAPGCTAIYRMS